MNLDTFIQLMGDSCIDRVQAQILLAQAMNAFESVAGPVFPVSDCREYPVHCGTAFIDPILSVSGIVTTCCSSTAVTGYCLGGVVGEAYTQVKGLSVSRIRVTGVFGSFSLENVPMDIKGALVGHAKANSINGGKGRVTKEKAGLVELTLAEWDNSGFNNIAGRYRRFTL